MPLFVTHTLVCYTEIVFGTTWWANLNNMDDHNWHIPSVTACYPCPVSCQNKIEITVCLFCPCEWLPRSRPGLPSQHTSQWWHSDDTGADVCLSYRHNGANRMQTGRNMTWDVTDLSIFQNYFDGLVKKRHNTSASAMELRLSCTNPSIYNTRNFNHF